ncbi:hypothetical protein MRX96_035278 [Rhipicephalus microplus]
MEPADSADAKGELAKENLPRRDGHPVLTDFQCKLNRLHGDHKKLQSGRSEHGKLTKNPSKYEIQVRKLKQELAGIKKNKVTLAAKIKEGSRRYQEAENSWNRHIAQMLKAIWQQWNRIISLEAKNCTKKTVLKRRQVEMSTLRRQILTFSLNIFNANARRCSRLDGNMRGSIRTRASTRHISSRSSKKHGHAEKQDAFGDQDERREQAPSGG